MFLQNLKLLNFQILLFYFLLLVLEITLFISFLEEIYNIYYIIHQQFQLMKNIQLKLKLIFHIPS